MPRHIAFTISMVLLCLVVPFASSCGGGGGGGGSGGGGGGGEEKGFRVLSTAPFDNEYAVARDVTITAEFSEVLTASTLTDDSFKVQEDRTGRVLLGTRTLEADGRTVQFEPSSLLARATRYRILATTDILDRFGERMKKDYVGTFNTVVTDPGGEEPPPPDPVGRLTTTGPMNEGRSSHSATLLTSGSVLVAGGWKISTAITNSAEVYNTSTKAFTALTSSLAVGRANHTATLLDDGRVLLVGGLANDGAAVTATTEIYNPGTASFSSGPDLGEPRCYHSATKLDDGRILICGGAQFNSSSQLISSRSAEIFDPTTNTFSALPNMAVYRSDHRATLLGDGKVLITGGSGSSKVAELFDPTKDSFASIVNEMKVLRSGHTATRMEGGTVLILGGGDRSATVYNPALTRFDNTPGIPIVDRISHTADLVRNGRVFIAGGYTWSPAWVFHASYEFFNGPPGERTFVPGEGLLNRSRAMHRSTRLKNDDVLITGGAGLDPALPEVAACELYTYVLQ